MYTLQEMAQAVRAAITPAQDAYQVQARAQQLSPLEVVGRVERLSAAAALLTKLAGWGGLFKKLWAQLGQPDEAETALLPRLAAAVQALRTAPDAASREHASLVVAALALRLGQPAAVASLEAPPSAVAPTTLREADEHAALLARYRALADNPALLDFQRRKLLLALDATPNLVALRMMVQRAQQEVDKRVADETTAAGLGVLGTAELVGADHHGVAA